MEANVRLGQSQINAEVVMERECKLFVRECLSCKHLVAHAEDRERRSSISAARALVAELRRKK
jgi:hypothetical protein